MQSYKHLSTITAIFVATLLVSNIASSAKIIDLGYNLLGLQLAFDAGTLLFPISYIFGDVLTEVYGFVRARKVIWTGFACSAAMSAYLWLVGALPGEAQWLGYAGNDAYAAILGGVSTGGIIVASLVAYLGGQFSNSIVMAAMKVKTDGRKLWARTIGSTLVGQGIDTVVFVVVACALGVFPWVIALSLIVANYLFKVSIEVALTPLTYKVVGYLKNVEGEDYFDRETKFSVL